MEIDEIFQNQELAEQLADNQIDSVEDFCVKSGYTRAEANELFSKLECVCDEQSVNMENLDADALDRVSGGFGLSKNQKSRAVIAGLLALNSVGGALTGGHLNKAQASAASQVVSTRVASSRKSFNDISVKVNNIPKVMEYTSFKIYSSQERKTARDSLERLLELAKETATAYESYCAAGRGQIAAQNLENAILNVASVLGENFKLDRNAVYNYGMCDKELRQALSLFERAITPAIAEAEKAAQLQAEEEKNSQIQAMDKFRSLQLSAKRMFEEEKGSIIDRYQSLENEANSVLNQLNKALKPDEGNVDDTLMNELNEILTTIKESSKEVETIQAPADLVSEGDSEELISTNIATIFRKARNTLSAVESKYDGIRKEALEAKDEIEKALLQCAQDEYAQQLDKLEISLDSEYTTANLNEERTKNVSNIINKLKAEISKRREELDKFDSLSKQGQMKRSIDSLLRSFRTEKLRYDNIMAAHKYEVNKEKRLAARSNFEVALQSLQDKLISFDQVVVGYENEVKQIRDFIESRSKNSPEINASKGLILKGPPGVGKTTTVRAIAAAYGHPIVTVSKSDLAGGPAVIKEKFEECLTLSNTSEVPGILLLDEIDSMSGDRGDKYSDKGMTMAVMDCIEKINKESNIAVIGTTNRLDQIDSAVVRPGRIEKSVSFENPSRDVLKKILETKLKEFHLEGGATETEFARDCMSLFAKPGTSGATAARVCEIAISSAQRQKGTNMLSEITITQKDMRNAASSLGLC